MNWHIGAGTILKPSKCFGSGVQPALKVGAERRKRPAFPAAPLGSHFGAGHPPLVVRPICHVGVLTFQQAFGRI